MEKKVFKYKFVYLATLSLNIFLFISFSLGVYNRIILNYFDDFLDIISFVVLFTISILSLISLILFIGKNKNSIIVFSTVLLLILLIFTCAIFYSIFIVKDFGESIIDFYLVPILYLVILSVLLGIYKFKYKQNISELEIEEIGTQ